MPLYKKSRFVLDIPLENQGENFFALYQTMTGGFILMPEKTWSDILNDLTEPADPVTVNMLCEQGFLIKEDVDETTLFETWKQQHVHDFSMLKSKVLVTRKCNNRCRYCIIDPEAREMSSKTARAMDRFYIEVIRDKNPRTVKDDYLGGEPLLNPGIILESASRRFFFCEGRGIEYSFTITTNGTLIKPSIISDMKEVGLTAIQVSMAGSAPVHDHLRPSINNGKTYDRIMKNLQAISGLIPIFIECQYDAGSMDYQRIPEMLDDIAEHKIQIENIAFTPILPRRGENHFNSGMGDPAKFLYLKDEAGKRGYPVNEEPPSNACMADLRAVFIFDTDGSIIPCPSLQGGEMAYGHVMTGIDFVSEAGLLKRRLPDRCLNQCEILPVCMGGCRLQALIHQKGFNGIDCHYEAYRLFLKDYIKKKASAFLSQEYDSDRKKAV